MRTANRSCLLLECDEGNPARTSSATTVDATRDATDAPRAATDRLIFNAQCSNALVGCGDGGGDDDDGGSGDDDDGGNGDCSVDAWGTFLSSFLPRFLSLLPSLFPWIGTQDGGYYSLTMQPSTALVGCTQHDSAARVYFASDYKETGLVVLGETSRHRRLSTYIAKISTISYEPPPVGSIRRRKAALAPADRPD